MREVKKKLKEDKYGDSPGFCDPVVRCTECSKIILTEKLKVTGFCPHCGCRKVRNLQVFNTEEKRQMEQWDVDPNFLALFETVQP